MFYLLLQIVKKSVKERETERKRETERQRDRETERKRDRKTRERETEVIKLN